MGLDSTGMWVEPLDMTTRDWPGDRNAASEV